MNPISIIIMALVTGAAAALKPTAEQAVKDAYASIKRLILDKYKSVNVTMLEADPANKARQDVIKQDLEKVAAGQDEEMLHKAKAVLDAVQTHAPDVPDTVGVKLGTIKAAEFEIARILAEGTKPIGVQLEHGEFTGSFTITDVTARSKEDTPPKKA